MNEEVLYPTQGLKFVLRKSSKEGFQVSTKVLQQLFVNQKQTIQKWIDVPVEEEILNNENENNNN